MSLIRWNPNREHRATESGIDRFFNDFFGPRNLAWPELSGTTLWEPAVDIYETSDELVVKAELPGMRREDLDVRLESRVLTLSGRRQAESEANRDNYHRVERSYGSFKRSFALPAQVEDDKIQAEYRDGVLSVRLPKVESAKPRRIEIAA